MIRNPVICICFVVGINIFRVAYAQAENLDSGLSVFSLINLLLRYFHDIIYKMVTSIRQTLGERETL